ncbi:MarR family winged helix-turn-helix transcriptional regulator [Saccharopolyspora sp. CA-218241]|uniref:MarR family winged helix-turn-helix transcriptional regulator n=1 Tax=Saccharopolyspora sp. CA-218241 TaxID=3240027 RepID=UPI003D9595D8
MSPHPPLTDDLGFLLSRASGVVARSASKALAPLDLRVRSYSVLALVVEHRGIAQRRLAALVGLDPSQIVALVDELQDRGLVVRAADPQDRRNKLVTATEDGVRLHGEARDRVAERSDRHFAGLPAERTRELREALQHVAFPAEEG